MDTSIIRIKARCGHTVEQAVRPGAADTIREVAAQYPCQDCRANANPFAPQRRFGRGRGSAR